MRISTMSLAAVLAVGASFVVSSTADARPKYPNVFKDVYPDLAEKADTAKCGICHFGEKKTNRNDYGDAMKEALGAKNVMDLDKVKAAIKKIEGETGKQGKTFGDLIKAGELPGKAPE